MRRNEDIVRKMDDLENARYSWMLDSITKFRHFFAGLTFALLAFSVQFSIKTSIHGILGVEIAGWCCLIVVGFLALRDAGGFVTINTEDSMNGLSSRTRWFMWFLFVIAILLLGAARIAAL